MKKKLTKQSPRPVEDLEVVDVVGGASDLADPENSGSVGAPVPAVRRTAGVSLKRTGRLGFIVRGFDGLHTRCILHPGKNEIPVHIFEALEEDEVFASLVASKQIEITDRPERINDLDDRIEI